jgi:hypothetical protein
MERYGVEIVLPASSLLTLQLLEQEVHHQRPRQIETARHVLNDVPASPPADHHGCVYMVLDTNSYTAETMPRWSLGDLLDDLERRHEVTQARAAELRHAPGWVMRVTERNASEVRTLVFAAPSIEVLHEAGLLDATRRHFTVCVEPDYREQLRSEIRAFDDSERLAQELRSFRVALANGLQRGLYTLIPQQREERRQGVWKDVPTLEPLHELLRVPASAEAWLWIDDRFLTSGPAINGNVVVSTFEVLEYLHLKCGMPDSEYLGLLATLRRGAALLLPSSSAEVLFWLRQADIRDGSLIETAPLRILRQAFNKTLLREADLDLDAGAQNRPRILEQITLVESLRLSRDCIEAIWKLEGTTLQQRLAWNDWVWSSLRVERFSRVRIGEDPNRLWRITIEYWLMLAWSLPWSENGDLTRQLMTWLRLHVAEIADHADDDVLDELARGMRERMVSILSEMSVEADRRVLTARVQLSRFVDALPQALAVRIQNDPTYREALGTAVRPVVGLGKVQFEVVEFWNTVTYAATGATPRLVAVDGQEFTVKGSSPTFIFKQEDGASLRLTNPDLILLSSDVAQRRDHLNDSREELCLPGVDWATEAERIATLPSARDRIETIRALRHQTAVGRYAWAERVEPGEDLEIDMLLPASASVYLDYLGIECDASAKPDWERSATSHVKRVGTVEVSRRWSGLPIAIPEALANAWRALPASAQRSALSTAEKQTAPGWLMRLALISQMSDDTAVAALLAAGLCDWEAEAELFLLAIKWSERAWHRDPQWRALPIALRLVCVWAHAGRVLGILRQLGVEDDVVRERMLKAHPLSVQLILPFERDYHADIASPQRATAEMLLIQGLNAALARSASPAVLAHRVEWCAHLTQVIEGKTLPRMHVLEDRRAGLDAMRSMLGSPLQAWLVEGVEHLSMLLPDKRDEIREQILQTLEAKASEVLAWVQVSCIGVPWLPTEGLSRVEAVIGRLQFAQSAADEDTSNAILCVTNAIPFTNTATRSLTEPKLIEWCKRLSEMHGSREVSLNGADGPSRDARVTAEMAVALSRRAELATSLAALAEIIRKCVSAWPSLVKLWRTIVERLMRECPSRDTEALWSTAVYLRSQP